MIFFVIDDAARNDFRNVTDPRRLTPTLPRYQATRLVAWNEVYPLDSGADPYRGLRDAVFAAAAVDPLCTAMVARSVELYGLDPTATGPSWWTTVVKDTLDYWAHPRIGNISANWAAPARRPAVDPPYQPGEDPWAACTFLDAATKRAIFTLDDELPLPKRSARDQVRICFNIVELARAVHGELTSFAPKRMEKLLAFELCQSAALEADLVELLSRARARDDVGASYDFMAGSEYGKYYFASVLSRSAEHGAVFSALWDGAIGRGAPAAPPDGYDAFEEIWTKLPPVIRLAILVNDLRKARPVELGRRFTTSMTHVVAGDTYGFGPAAPDLPLTVSNQQRAGTGWRFVENWTRDERHHATRSARTLLTPTWAGPSGHAAKNLSHYRTSLGSAYPERADMAIPAALFALWRVYYDRRYSPAHTLVETCEGTTYVDEGGRLSRVRRSFAEAATVAPPLPTDGYGMFEHARFKLPPPPRTIRNPLARPAPGTTYQLLDGVRVLELLRRREFDGTSGPGTSGPAAREQAVEALQDKIDAQRSQLATAGYVVPRWSHELDADVTGVAVTSFRPPANTGRRRVRPTVGQ